MGGGNSFQITVGQVSRPALVIVRSAHNVRAVRSPYAVVATHQWNNRRKTIDMTSQNGNDAAFLNRDSKYVIVHLFESDPHESVYLRVVSCFS